MSECRAGCGSPAVDRGSFCGRSCAASFNNRIKPKRVAKESSCEGCKKYLKGNRKFCSNSCQKRHEREVFILDWKSGKVSGKVGMSVSGHVRAYLLERCSSSCESCHHSEWLGKPLLLQVDHRDGDFRSCSESNLWMICPNCHAQQPTSGSKNRGRGRKNRLVYSKKTNLAIKEAMKALFSPP